LMSAQTILSGIAEKQGRPQLPYFPRHRLRKGNWQIQLIHMQRGQPVARKL